jgi:hypothetical protein
VIVAAIKTGDSVASKTQEAVTVQRISFDGAVAMIGPTREPMRCSAHGGTILQHTYTSSVTNLIQDQRDGGPVVLAQGSQSVSCNVTKTGRALVFRSLRPWS